VKYPKKTKEMNWTKLGNIYIISDPKSKKTHNIDTVSFLVWIQCDGKTSVEDIVDVFSVDGNRDIVKAAINGILEKLEEKGLITWV